MQAVLCVEWNRYERGFERNRRAFLTDDESAPEEVAILCPECADREFGPPQLGQQADEGSDS